MRKNVSEILKTLAYDSMCYNCEKFRAGCKGSKSKIYSGCVYRNITPLNIYNIALYIPELIKNYDFKSFDNFLENLANDREGVIKWLKSRIAGEHFKNEIITLEYIESCKKLLQIIDE